MLNATSIPSYDYPIYSEEVTNSTNFVPDFPIGPRVLRGDNARPGEFAHQAYLLISLLDGTVKCGASIIHPMLLLTAAHCVYDVLNPQKITVVTGEHDTSVNEGREQWLSVRSAVIHESYNEDESENDIALLILQSPIRLDNFSKAIKIPQPNQSLPAWAYISGWGTLGNESSALILQKARVAFKDMESCRLAYGRKGLTVTEETICAGDGTKDACRGDSGGPLTCEDAGQKFLCGIVSWGDACKDRIKYEYDTPGVYVDVRQFYGWIQSHVQRWSEFYAEHFLPQPAPGSNGRKWGVTQSFKAKIRSWWEHLRG